MTSQGEIDLERLEKHASDLAEHFDSVEIIATRHQPNEDDEDDSGTVTVYCGKGNWAARMGSVRDWLIKQDERTRRSVED